MNHKLRIAVVDEHPLYREGVVHTTTAQPDMEVVGQGETAEDAIGIIKNAHPDLLVISLSASGGGMKALEYITLQWPHIRILALAASADDEQACAVLRHGVRGYILKEVSGAELVKTIRALGRGESYISPSFAARILSRFGPGGMILPMQKNPFSGLSCREQQILSRLADGMSNKEIAIKLDLSEKTIKHYVTKIFQKLQVRNRVEAAILASERAHPRMPMFQQDLQ